MSGSSSATRTRVGGRTAIEFDDLSSYGRTRPHAAQTGLIIAPGMRPAALFLLVPITVVTLAAQGAGPVRNDTMHLTVNTSISDVEAAPGKKLSITFDVTPKRSMHVYAPGKHDYQVITVKIDPQPWLKVAPTIYPPSEIYDFKELNEKVEVYSK